MVGVLPRRRTCYCGWKGNDGRPKFFVADPIKIYALNIARGEYPLFNASAALKKRLENNGEHMCTNWDVVQCSSLIAKYTEVMKHSPLERWGRGIGTKYPLLEKVLGLKKPVNVRSRFFFI